MFNKQFKGIIYQVINIQNGKSYIGQTNQNFKKYKKHHINSALRNIDKDTRYFYCSFRKYGEQNFKWIVLGEIKTDSREDLIKQLNEAEIEAIWLFRTFGSDGENFDRIYGYNMTQGGGGFSGVKRKSRSQIYKDWVLLYGEDIAKLKLITWSENQGKSRKGKSTSLKNKTWDEIYKDKEKVIVNKKKASEHFSKIRKNQDPWNKGLSAKTDERVRKNTERSSKTQKGRIPWNRGLSKETDERVRKNGESTSKTKQKMNLVAWNKGLTKETDERVLSYGKSNRKPRKKLKCPYCGKEGGDSNMTRYHFNNCKNKK